MLFRVGPLTISRRPYNVEEWERESTASWAKRELLGRRSDREFTGDSDETLTLKGTLFPFNLNLNAFGGLSSIELAHSLRRTGTPVFVVRGDGRVFGFYGIESVSESHSEIGPHTAGVGQKVEHELKLVPVGQPGIGSISEMISTLTSLFG